MKTNGIQFIPKENETFTLEECNIFTVNGDTIIRKKSKKIQMCQSARWTRWL